MSRFVFINFVIGFLAAAIGFGDFAGVPNQVIFVARIIAGVCLLLVVAYMIASISPATRGSKRRRRDHVAHSRTVR